MIIFKKKIFIILIIQAGVVAIHRKPFSFWSKMINPFINTMQNNKPINFLSLVNYPGDFDVKTNKYYARLRFKYI